MELVQAKLLAMFLLGGASLLIGLLPLILKRRLRCLQAAPSKRGEEALSGILCFGGGVILATSLTEMLPELNEELERNIERGLFPETGLNLGEIFVLCGFFMVYLVEEVAHMTVDRYAAKRRTEEKVSWDGNEGAAAAQAEPLTHQHHGKPHEEVPAAEIIASSSSVFEASVRGFLVILALSLHGVFEGIALGLASSESSVWLVFAAMSAHKYVITFCVGMQFVSSGIHACLTVVFISTLSLISPVGAGIGIALSEAAATTPAALQTSIVTVLQGLATGTLLYVVVFEIVEKERQKGTNGILIVGCLMTGALAIILIGCIEVFAGDGHGH